MTIRVVVQHDELDSPHPLEVLRSCDDPTACKPLGVVQPGDSAEFFVWRGSSLTIREKV